MDYQTKLFVAEYQFIKRLITDIYPSGVVSIVSDSFDFWKVITEIAPTLKNEILSRVPDQLGLAKVVFRPDSGDPVQILCGRPYSTVKNMDDICALIDAENTGHEVVYSLETKKYYEFCTYDTGWSTDVEYEQIPEHIVKGSVECLWDTFGGTVNEKGFKTLNQRVGLIYGDSITTDRCNEILKQLAKKGFASDNVVFGIGSFTFQYNTRDTLGFAMKATYIEVEGKGISIFKDPKTDNGTKKSAKGLLKVDRVDGKLALFNDVTAEEEQQGMLRPVFKDGTILVKEDFADIRSRLGVI